MSEAPQGRLDAFVAGMDVELDRLRRTAERHPNLLPLDLSYESVDRVEDLVGRVGGKLPSADAPGVIALQAARYLGETLRRHAGGAWALAPKPRRDQGEFYLRSMAELPKAHGFNPLGAVSSFLASRYPGLLRERVERNDLSLRRAWFEAWLKGLETSLARLQRALPEVAPDVSFESVDRLQAALLGAYRRGVARDDKRALQGASARYLTEVLCRHVQTEPELCEDPQDIEFGTAVVGGFAPSRIVIALETGVEPGFLRAAIEGEIEDAQE